MCTHMNTVLFTFVLFAHIARITSSNAVSNVYKYSDYLNKPIGKHSEKDCFDRINQGSV